MSVSIERREVEQRNRDVKRMTHDGASLAEISEVLRISTRTVLRHRRREALSLSAEPVKPRSSGRPSSSPTMPDERYYNELRIGPCDWEAACWGYDPEMWFPDASDNETRVKAKAICMGCPGKSKCLQWSFDADERYGIWGGLSQNERYKITKRR